MLTHVVLFWTKPDVADAPDRVLAGARQFLSEIPSLRGFHVGRMVPSPRAVVEQSYQVGLLIQVDDKAAELAYQEHPLHKRFVEEIVGPFVERVRVFDFQ